MTHEPRDWVVYDLNEYDPWGVKGPAFGPMTEAAAKAMEAAGRAAKTPLAYAAVRLRTATAPDEPASPLPDAKGQEPA